MLERLTGTRGPMTIHGPSSERYDAAKAPILMTDWLHRSAFDVWSDSIHYGTSFRMENILVNGKGLPPPNTPLESIRGEPERYSLVFETVRDTQRIDEVDMLMFSSEKAIFTTPNQHVCRYCFHLCHR